MRNLRALFLLLVCNLVCVNQVCVNQAGAAENSAASWQTYGGDSDAFTMKYPSGWSVVSDPKSGRVEVTDGSGAKLTAQPFFSPTPIKAADAPMFFKGFMRSFAPQGQSGQWGQWSEPVAVGANGLRATSVSATESAVAAMVFASSPQGTVGKICLARMPRGAANAQLFADMMTSLRYNRPPAAMQNNNAGFAAPQQAITYRKFVDPTEHSFSVDVPVGWKVEGGMYRPVSIDARPWVKVVSPDDLMVAFIGDGKIPPYSMPTALGAQLGYGVGSKYGGGEVRSYIPARKYVEQYARNSLKKYISNIQVVEAHDHPDIAQTMNGTVGATRSEASSIKFTGQYGNIPAVGYYLASTKATVAYGAGMWWVTLIAGELSPADRSQLGLEIICHMISTFQLDPVWKGESVANAGAVSRQYTAASQAVSKSIVDRYWSQQAANESNNAAYWQRQAVQDHAADNFSDYIRGQQTVQDPGSGNQYKVNYGPQYHWIDGGGNVMGTDYSAPGPEWRQLMAVP